MCQSTMFKKAHKLTKKTLRKGDNYAATFALCLKQVMADNATIVKYEFVTTDGHTHSGHFTIYDSAIVPLSVTEICVSALSIITIFTMTLLFINYF